jgi:signal transduction histidine kinase
VGHAPWVEEVLVNAISQAIARGGQPPRVELGAQVEADGQTSFWVRDNGVSPTAEAPAQPHNKLGLFVVRRIMERLGRQNWESQKSSQGNTFTFTLPSAKP